MIIDEGATRQVNTGWEQLGTKKIGHYGDGPEAARKYPFRSGAYRKVRRKTALDMMVAEAGFGPIRLAQLD